MHEKRRQGTGAIRRRIATAVVGATAVGAAPLLGGVAGAQTTPPPTPEAADIGPLCVNIPDGLVVFEDAGATFEAEINCLALAGITAGTGDGSTYEPGRAVPRDQVATFVANLLDTADQLDTADNIQALPGPGTTDEFTDLEGNVHADSINRLAAAGILTGGPGDLPDTEYGPSLPVSRGQLATVLARAHAFMTGAPTTTTDDFFTDDEDSVHEGNINVVASLGLALGTGPNTFEPGRTVNRGQMSAFLLRTLGERQVAGDIAEVPYIDPEASGATAVDNEDGTATITLTVQLTDGEPVTGLPADAFSFMVGATMGSFVGETFPTFTDNDDGTYTVVWEPAEPGSATLTDVSVGGVVIEESLTVTATAPPAEEPPVEETPAG